VKESWQRVQYAIELLSQIKGIYVPVIKSPCFKEFVVDFEGTGKTVREINRELLSRQIFGGKDISQEFPVYGNSRSVLHYRGSYQRRHQEAGLGTGRDLEITVKN